MIRAYTNDTFLRGPEDPLVRQYFKSAIEQAERLESLFPDDPKLAKEHGGLLNNYGDFLLKDVGDLDAAESQYQDSADDFAKLASEKPLITEYKSFLVLAWIGLGDVASAREDRVEAEKRYRKAVEFAEQMLQQNSNRNNFRATAAQAKASLSAALLHQDLDESENLLASAITLVPDNADTQDLRAFIQYTRACLHVVRSQQILNQSPESADRELDQALTCLRDALETGTRTTGTQ